MNTWKIILATMVIFGSGVVTGGLLVQHARIARPSRAIHTVATNRPAPAITPSGMRLELLRRMQRELDLTPEQREQVDRILKESQEHVRKITEPVAPDIRRALQKAAQEFREVLTPAQRERFEEAVKQQQKAHEARKGKPAPKSPPPVESTNPPSTVPSSSP